ncbi:MAG: flagellar hook-associated protein 2 [Pelotomaculum sp.]|nr:flagellar hook-associated protein 2 [Pelotomaculum sp.]
MSSIFPVSSSLRIGGLASGIDTDSIIEELMKAKRIPLQKLEQNKQILLWQQEDYRELNTSLRTFRDKVFSMKLQATYMTKKAVSSNESAVGASAGTGAVPGIYSVTVNQLAAGVSVGSQAGLPDEANGSGGTKSLADQFFGGVVKDISFTLEGSKGSKTFTFNTGTDNIYSVVSAINAAGLGISASYDATLNRFFLTTTSTGAAAKIKVTNDTDDFLADAAGAGGSKLKLLLKNDGTVYAGQDAVFSFGDAAGLTSSTNTVTVNGITLTLKQGGGASSTVTVSNDTDAVFNAIKDFVSAYNDLIGKINGKLSETRYSDYLPLTDEQRKELTDEQEKKWEEKARSGLLRNDSLLESIVIKMRMTMSAVVPGLSAGEGYNSLAGIGITTGSYSEKGKLYIDEDKLKEALQKDPEGVMNLFTKSSDVYSEKGIAARLYDDVNNGITLISEKAGSDSSYTSVDNSAIGRRIKQIDEEIDRMEDRLAEMEDRYWRQFTALEQAVSRMNAQSAWLFQQFGGGNR